MYLLHLLFYIFEIFSVCDDPIVSSDIIEKTKSAIVNSALTSVNEKIIKLLGWYDAETAYAKRLVDLAELLCLDNLKQYESTNE